MTSMKPLSKIKPAPESFLEALRVEKTELKGPRLLLKIFDEEQLSLRYVEWFNDPVVCRFNRHGSGYSLEKAKDYLRQIKNSPDTLVFSIWTQEGNQHIGNISLNGIEWQKRSGEISILIGEKKIWGKGFAGEAVRLLRDFAFNRLELESVWMGFTVTHPAMRRIAQTLGFQYLRTLPGAFQKKDEAPHDIEEWECARRGFGEKEIK